MSLAQEELFAKLKNPAFTPSLTDLAGLWRLLPSANEEEEKTLVKVLLRRDVDALKEGLKIDLASDQSGNIAAALGRIAAETWKDEKSDSQLVSETGRILVHILETTPENSRSVKSAIRALGNLEEFDSADVLHSFWSSPHAQKHMQALIIALGKVGDSRSLELLERDSATINEQLSLRAALASAILLLKRRIQRSEKSEIDARAVVPGFGPVEVRFHCRAGLEQILIDECPRNWEATAQKQGEVLVKYSGPIGDLFKVRTAESFGFPIRVTGATNSIEAVEIALTDPRTRALIKGLTQGRPTYRLEWSDDGARRSVTRDLATRISKRAPELVNETRQPLWQLVIRRRVREIDIELFPRGLHDPRFAWRSSTVAASSHAPLSAALVRLSRPAENDVVWDPFAGAGTELIERALVCRAKKIVGTDLSSSAIVAAKENFIRAKSTKAEIDPIEFINSSCFDNPPKNISKIITNPPLGRRVEAGGAEDLLARFLPVAYESLCPGGKLVWVTPSAAVTDKVAIRLGFEILFHADFDMGGFHAQIQCLQKPTF